MSESVFEPVTLTWDEKEYEVPADQVMGLICRIEDHISFADLAGDVKFGKVSTAYAAALRYAGAKVTTDQVFKSMFKGATGGQVQQAINGLMMIMIPPEHLQKKTEVEASETVKKKSSKKAR